MRMPVQQRIPTTSLVVLVAMGGIWGLQPGLVKLAVEGGVSEADVFAIGLFGVAICFGLYLLATRAFFRITSGRIAFFVADALIGVIAPLLVRVLCAPHLPASLMALIICSTPLFAIGLSFVLRSETITRRRIAGVGLGSIAIAVILMPDVTLADRGQIVWAALLMAIPVLYAVSQQVAHRFWPKDLNAQQVAAGENITAGILFLPVYLLIGGPGLSTIEWTPGHWAITGWAVLSLVDSIMFFLLIKREGPSFVAFGTFIAIFSGAAWGIALFGESISIGMAVSGTLLCAALLMVALERRTAAAE